MAIIDSKGRPVTRLKKPQTPPRLVLAPEEAKAHLNALMNAAVKADRKQFGGRPDYVRIAAAILPDLDATQVQLLKDGAFGPVMARAIAGLCASEG